MPSSRNTSAAFAALPHAFAHTLVDFKLPSGKRAQLYSLPELSKSFPNVARLPVSLRIVLESVLRNCAACGRAGELAAHG